MARFSNIPVLRPTQPLDGHSSEKFSLVNNLKSDTGSVPSLFPERPTLKPIFHSLRKQLAEHFGIKRLAVDPLKIHPVQILWRKYFRNHSGKRLAKSFQLFWKFGVPLAHIFARIWPQL